MSAGDTEARCLASVCPCPSPPPLLGEQTDGWRREGLLSQSPSPGFYCVCQRHYQVYLLGDRLVGGRGEERAGTRATELVRDC